MQICKVIGHVWATKKESSLSGLKLMVVQEDMGPRGAQLVAADIVGAGIGERVLVVSGSTARKALGKDEVAVDAACCAGVTPESHRTALAAMRPCQITVEHET